MRCAPSSPSCPHRAPHYFSRSLHAARVSSIWTVCSIRVLVLVWFHAHLSASIHQFRPFVFSPSPPSLHGCCYAAHDSDPVLIPTHHLSAFPSSTCSVRRRLDSHRISPSRHPGIYSFSSSASLRQLPSLRSISSRVSYSIQCSCPLPLVHCPLLSHLSSRILSHIIMNFTHHLRCIYYYNMDSSPLESASGFPSHPHTHLIHPHASPSSIPLRPPSPFSALPMIRGAVCSSRVHSFLQHALPLIIMTPFVYYSSAAAATACLLHGFHDSRLCLRLSASQYQHSSAYASFVHCYILSVPVPVELRARAQ